MLTRINLQIRNMLPISEGVVAVLQKEFVEERIRLIRSLAGKADPFIKRRLLDLAQRYDGGTAPSKAVKDIRAISPLQGFFAPSSER